jgi:hypothetical protein
MPVILRVAEKVTEFVQGEVYVHVGSIRTIGTNPKLAEQLRRSPSDTGLPAHSVHFAGIDRDGSPGMSPADANMIGEESDVADGALKSR